jgi:hypothetical protein
VDVYHSEGVSEAWVGVFINGSGGDDYYVFRIQPNEDGCGSSGGDWELRRRKDNKETVLRSGACHPSIKRGYGSGNVNTIKISHATDRNLSVSVNGTLLAIFQEENTGNHLTGTGVGVYVLADNVDVLMKFDNFKVFKFSN